jgi:tetratricopeptide (TPR) repeat protein
MGQGRVEWASHVPALLLSLLLSSNPHLDQGRSLFRALKYDEALKPLERATQATTSTQAERRESFDLYARALAALGRIDEAERAYAALLATDPMAPAPAGVAPKISDAWLRAKRGLYRDDWVRLSALPAAAGELRIEVLDPWARVATLELAQGEQRTTLELVAGTARATPAAGTWTVNALDAGGRAVASLSGGAPVAVVAVPPPVPAEEPVHLIDAPPSGGRWKWQTVVTSVLAALSAGACVTLGVLAHSTSVVATHEMFASNQRAQDLLARGYGIGAWASGAGGLVFLAAAIVFGAVLQ